MNKIDCCFPGGQAARIRVLRRFNGLPEMQNIQVDGLRAIARDFQAQLRKDFLDRPSNKC